MPTDDLLNPIALMADPSASLEAAKRLHEATAGSARRGGFSARSARLQEDDDEDRPIPVVLGSAPIREPGRVTLQFVGARAVRSRG